MTWPWRGRGGAGATLPAEPTADTIAHLLAAADMVQFGGWVQGVGARDGGGAVCQPEDPRAQRWCAAGAIRADARLRRGRHFVGQAERSLESFIRRLGWDNIAAWNDDEDRTAGEVADVLRRVAKELGERGEEG